MQPVTVTSHHRGSGHCLSRRAAAIGAGAQPQGPDFRKYARAAQWVGGVTGGWDACWNMFILLFLLVGVLGFELFGSCDFSFIVVSGSQWKE